MTPTRSPRDAELDDDGSAFQSVIAMVMVARRVEVRVEYVTRGN